MRKFFGHLEAAKYATVNSNEKHPDKYAHYGLNFPLYTHFTSPIRRYADLLVHRLTTLCLNHGPKVNEVIEKMDYSAYAENCSEKSLNSKRASKQCNRLFHCLLLKNESGAQSHECLVYDLDEHSLHIHLEKFNLNHKIRLKEDPRFACYKFDEEKFTTKV